MLHYQFKEKSRCRAKGRVGGRFARVGEITILPLPIYKPVLHFRKVSDTGEWTFGDQLIEDLTRRVMAKVLKRAALLAVKPPTYNPLSHFRNYSLEAI